MASTRKRNLTQFLVLVVAVIIVVAGSIAFQKWWNDRPGTEPRDVQLTATTSSGETKIAPYTVCEPGVECPEGTVPQVPLDDGSLKISVPKDVYDHDWSVLKIYDDPAANDQTYFKGNESKEVEIPATSSNGSRLVVVEVSTVLIGRDSAGTETPYTVVWSINTQ